MKTKEILIAARAKIEQPECWTQMAFAKTALRNKAKVDSPRAVCWCILGAICAVTNSKPGLLDVASYRLIANAIGVPPYSENVVNWNDERARTHAEVLAAFDRAIEDAP